MRISRLRMRSSPITSSSSGDGTSVRIATPDQSPLSSSTWNDAAMVKIAFPRCSASTRRAENDRPSRSRLTFMIVGCSASPARR